MAPLGTYRRLLRPLLSGGSNALALLGAVLVVAGSLTSFAGEFASALGAAHQANTCRPDELQTPGVVLVSRPLHRPSAVRASGQALPPQPKALQTWLLAPTPSGELWLLGQRKLRASRFSTPEAGLIAHLPQGPPPRAA
ncbi:MAG TPA: hypothetical protein VGK67_05380 [Myxococcales bacterium]|jgi:hypothetical protein